MHTQKLLVMFYLKGFVDEFEIKQRELTELLDVSQSTISNMINGKLPFSDEKVEILRTRYGSDAVDKYCYEGEYVQSENIGVKLLPLMPVSAQGGTLNEFVASVKAIECEKIISPIKDADIAISVAGDSMAPEYPSGSKVLAKKINEHAFIEWGHAHVLDTCNGVVIKLLVPSEKEGCIRCVSINESPLFAPFDVSLSDVYGIYRVQLCMSVK